MSLLSLHSPDAREPINESGVAIPVIIDNDTQQKCGVVAPPCNYRGNVSVLKVPSDVQVDDVNSELLTLLGQCAAVLASSAPVPNQPDEAFCKARLEMLLNVDPMILFEFLKQSGDFSNLSQFSVEQRKYLLSFRENFKRLYDNLDACKRSWEKRETTCFRSHMAKWMSSGAQTEFMYQLFMSPVKTQSGEADVDRLALMGFLSRMVHLLICDFFARNDLSSSNAMANITVASEKSWASCSSLLPSVAARAKPYVSRVVSALKGEQVENLGSAASSSSAVPVTSSLNSSVQNMSSSSSSIDPRDKAIENLARFVGIVDASVPQLAAGISNNGVRMPSLVIPYNGRFVVSKHYPQHPNTPDLSPSNTGSETGSTTSHRGGRGGYRGGGRGGRGGRGGHANGGNEQGGDVNEN